MNKFTCSMLVASFSLTVAFSQQVQQDWVQIVAGARDPRGIKSTGGSTYVLGHVTINGATNFALIKYNSNGVQQWVQYYPGGGNSMVLDNAGNIYITGNNDLNGGTHQQISTVKYDPSGALQWVATYYRPDAFYHVASSLAVDRFGNVAINGTINYNGEFAATDFITIRYNSSGVEQWVRTFNGTANDIDLGLFIGVDGSGNVYAAGPTTGRRNLKGAPSKLTSVDTHEDYVVIKYDVNGNRLWKADYITSYDDDPRALKVDFAGNAYLAGMTTNTGSISNPVSLIAVLALAPNGARRWVAKYDGPGSDGVNAMAVDASGNVYVVGSTQPLTTDGLIVKFDGSGVLQWANTYNGPANETDAFYDIGISFDQGIYVTGTSTGIGTLDDFVTIFYTSAGVRVWTARYNDDANGYDRVQAIAVFQSEGPAFIPADIYVTGVIAGNPSSIVTIKYSQPILPAPTMRPSASATEQAYTFKLSNYPNPFNSSTRIEYQLPATSRVSIKIYDVAGKEIMTVVNGEKPAGIHQQFISARLLSKGTYVYRLIAESKDGRFEKTATMIKQ